MVYKNPLKVLLLFISLYLTSVDAYAISKNCDLYLRIENSDLLFTRCWLSSGYPVLAAVKLGRCIGNDSGTMRCGGSGFETSCTIKDFKTNSITRDKTVYRDPSIIAVCRNYNGSARELNMFRLDYCYDFNPDTAALTCGPITIDP